MRTGVGVGYAATATTGAPVARARSAARTGASGSWRVGSTPTTMGAVMTTSLLAGWQGVGIWSEPTFERAGSHPREPAGRLRGSADQVTLPTTSRPIAHRAAWRRSAP